MERFQRLFKMPAQGDKWYNEGKVMILKVPSAVMPDGFNYVINTAFPGYNAVQLIDTTDLVPDARIEDLLKKYRG